MVRRCVLNRSPRHTLDKYMAAKMLTSVPFAVLKRSHHVQFMFFPMGRVYIYFFISVVICNLRTTIQAKCVVICSLPTTINAKWSVGFSSHHRIKLNMTVIFL